MRLVETQEFSIQANPMFENARVFAGSISLKCQPQTTFSPQMSVWTADVEQDVSPQDWLTNVVRDDDPLVERKAVAFAGMHGEMVKLKGRLEDWETTHARDWYRLRALLVAADGGTWYHATAMTSDADLAAIEADFERLLGSIQVKLDGAAASGARMAGDEQKDAVLSQVKKALDAAAVVQLERENALAKATGDARARAPVADIETRFEKAVAMLGLDDKRELLRQIVVPTVSLTEIDVADKNAIGLSRIGGGPDLPEGMDWPRDASGFHLNFLAQIELAELPERAEILPQAGLLAFFTGSDYSDWRVLFTPPGTALVAHALPDDAIDTTESALRMAEWNRDQDRFVANGVSVDGLSVDTDAQGRMTFKRDGRAVMVFASEYEISQSAQGLRLERSLSAPFDLSGSNRPTIDADAELDDLSDFALAIAERFQVGDGPQHQMFGICGIRGLSAIQQLAAEHASRQGWSDIATPDDWFILIKLASGGQAGFSFSDHGDYIFMAHRKDAAKGDFSRVYAFVESG
ncbi:DUF1963 domain-containing protein [Xanthomonas sp. 3058]|uniref:DUF1963 domain-containing protein n=1 Tax=Xanthomonas sp. 3058 TaxID=3035314 RepID=UPI001615F808|nr:DUF1963 domain-containing protein [Xanthomonas sp. 3058]MBB5863278.1 hypothetical protein [Xanthomonas sp. 3058]